MPLWRAYYAAEFVRNVSVLVPRRPQVREEPRKMQSSVTKLALCVCLLSPGQLVEYYGTLFQHKATFVQRDKVALAPNSNVHRLHLKEK